MASEREIVAEYNQRRARLQAISAKVEELANEVGEHELVIKTLEPMDASRKTWRLIGDVLVERTVADTLPAVTKNKENLQAAASALNDTRQDLEKQLLEFQTKHKIKLVDKRTGKPVNVEPEEAAAPAAASSSAGSSQRGQGVLVGK